MDAPSCLACGDELPAPLAQTGSLRCADCRDDHAPLDPLLCTENEEREAA